MNLQELNLYLQDKDLDLFEMANIRLNKTGLPMVIYISPRNSSKHEPRIKVSKQYGEKTSSNFFSISFNNSGEIELVHKDTGEILEKDVNIIIEFMKLNLDILLDLWYDRIDSIDAANQFKKVG